MGQDKNCDQLKWYISSISWKSVTSRLNIIFTSWDIEELSLKRSVYNVINLGGTTIIVMGCKTLECYMVHNGKGTKKTK